jgi:copper transport protein
VPRGVRWRQPAGAAALMALLVLLVAPAVPGATGGVALGHAQLVASSPSAGEIVATAPTELRLVFSEPLEPEFSYAEVTASDGTVVVAHGGAVDGDDAFQLVVRVPALDDGIYVVTWHSLSAADGHSADGLYSFGVGDTLGQTPSAVSTPAHEETDPLDTAARWLTYLGLFAALGVPLFLRLVLRVPAAALPMRIVGGLLAVSAAASLLLAIRAATESEGVFIDYLIGSRNGQLQLARALVLAVGAGVVLATAGRRAAWASATAAAAAAIGIALLVAAGHSAALPSPVAIVTQFVHVAAAAVWASGVGSLTVLMVRPEVLGVPRETVSVRTALPRFSALALAAIGLVATTGAYEAWSETETFAWFGTEYGRTLALKTALALAALTIGALNFFDGGRHRPWLGGLRIRVGVEIGLVLVVLVVTAQLAQTAPDEEGRGVALAPLPDAFGETVPGMTLSLVPGRPGVNQAIVTATGGIGYLPAELGLDRLDAQALTRLPLTPVGGGTQPAPMPSMEGMVMPTPAPAVGTEPRWIGNAIVLPAGTEWDANVRIFAADGVSELLRQRFSFTMGDDSVASGRLAAIVDPLAVIGLLLLVGGTLAVGLGAGGWRLPRCDAAASRVALVGGGAIGWVLGILIGASQLLRG